LYQMNPFLTGEGSEDKINECFVAMPLIQKDSDKIK